MLNVEPNILLNKYIPHKTLLSVYCLSNNLLLQTQYYATEHWIKCLNFKWTKL